MKIKADLLSRPRVKSYGYLHLSHHLRLWRNQGNIGWAQTNIAQQSLGVSLPLSYSVMRRCWSCLGATARSAWNAWFSSGAPRWLQAETERRMRKLQYVLHIDTPLRKEVGGFKRKTMALNTWFIKHDHFTSVTLYFINQMRFQMDMYEYYWCLSKKALWKLIKESIHLDLIHTHDAVRPPAEKLPEWVKDTWGGRK